MRIRQLSKTETALLISVWRASTQGPGLEHVPSHLSAATAKLVAKQLVREGQGVIKVRPLGAELAYHLNEVQQMLLWSDITREES